MELRFRLRSSRLIDNLLPDGLGTPGPFAFYSEKSNLQPLGIAIST